MILDDCQEDISAAILKFVRQGADMVLCTGGCFLRPVHFFLFDHQWDNACGRQPVSRFHRKIARADDETLVFKGYGKNP